MEALQSMGREEQPHLRALTDPYAEDPRLEPRLLLVLGMLSSASRTPMPLEGTAHAVSVLGFGPVALLSAMLRLLRQSQQDAAAHADAAAGARARATLAVWRRALMSAVLARALLPRPLCGQRPWLLALLHHLPGLLGAVPDLPDTAAPAGTAPALGAGATGPRAGTAQGASDSDEAAESRPASTAALARTWRWSPDLCEALQTLEDDPGPGLEMPSWAAADSPWVAALVGADPLRTLHAAIARAPGLLNDLPPARLDCARACAAAALLRQPAPPGSDTTSEMAAWGQRLEQALDDWTTLAQVLGLPPLPAAVRAPPAASDTMARGPRPATEPAPGPRAGSAPQRPTAIRDPGPVSAAQGLRAARLPDGHPSVADGLPQRDGPGQTTRDEGHRGSVIDPVNAPGSVGSGEVGRGGTTQVRHGASVASATPKAAQTSQTTQTTPSAASVLLRAPPRPPLSTLPALARAIEDLSLGLLGEAPLGELVEPALETALQALQWQRLMLCLPEPGVDGPLAPRHAVGERLRVLLPQIRIRWMPPTDLFGLLAQERQDIVVNDALRPGRSGRLPAWFLEHAGAAGFVALSVGAADDPPGLLYGDVPLSHRLVIDEPTLGQLRTLRNLITVALRLRRRLPPKGV